MKAWKLRGTEKIGSISSRWLSRRKQTHSNVLPMSLRCYPDVAVRHSTEHKLTANLYSNRQPDSSVPTLLTPEQKVEKETQKTGMINLRKENEELLVSVRCGIMKSFYG